VKINHTTSFSSENIMQLTFLCNTWNIPEDTLRGLVVHAIESMPSIREAALLALVRCEHVDLIEDPAAERTDQ
jgi:hypothetical protein